MPTIFPKFALLFFLFLAPSLLAEDSRQDAGFNFDELELLAPLDFGVEFSSSEWLQFGKVASHMSKNFKFDSELPLSRAWSKKISYSRKGESYSNAVARDGLLYVLDAGAKITAFDSYDGSVIWAKELRGDRYANVGGGLALGDLLYAVDGDGAVYAIEPMDGEIFWLQSLDTPVSVPPLWDDGRLYVVTQDNKIYSIKGEDGSIDWSYSAVPQNRVLMNHAAPSASGRLVVVPFASGEIKALSTFDGREIWSKSMLLSKGGNLNLLPAVSAPIVSKEMNRVFYASQAYEVGALSLVNGDTVWELDDVSSVQMPVIVNGKVIIVTRDERLLVLNASDGGVIWNLELPFQSPDSGKGFIFFRKSKKIVVWHSPIVAGGKIWLVSYKGHLVVYDGKTGEINSIQNLINNNSKERITSPPIWVNETLYIVSDSGKVSAWR